jgi:peptidoglycan hydrolase-like protein with peptidoglycan-binding domain
VLYTVDETPVVAVAGETPAFRTLENGTHGADVLQLEDFLAEKGFLRSAPDGRFDWETTAAVKVWQADLGAPQSGVLPLGSIVFLRSFPVQMVAAEALRLGAPVADGVTLFEVVADDPTMELLLGADQAGNVPPGAPVEVTMGGGIVHAAAGAQREVDGQISVALQGADGKSAPCPHPCGAVPVQGVTQFPASVTVLGPATGPVVPVAAIETDAAGATTVLDENGAKRPVKVLLQVGGQAVVSGVAVGDRVRLPSSTS